jgi:hypothetical protein
VYEVSHCRQGLDWGLVTGGIGPGIEPELYLWFTPEHTHESVVVPGSQPNTFTNVCDPNAWTETRENLLGVLKSG